MRKPIYDTIIKYSHDSGYPWHMPGHKRHRSSPESPDIEKLYAMDFTEIPGLDEYHCPEGIIREAQVQAAGLYGTKNSYFLVNGSTVGILAAISAVCRRRDSILIARNCHRSVYNAVELLELKPFYVVPDRVGAWDIYGGVSWEAVEKCMEAHTDIRVVVVTSPTYEGVVSDIRKIAEVVHAHNGILITDEAHGAHLPFMKRLREEGTACQPDSRLLRDTGEEQPVWPMSVVNCGADLSVWPVSAVDCGADLVVQSLHKTLPVLTQTAILHRISDRVSEERLFHFVSLYQTTSPSYVLMADMDYGICYMAEERERILAYETGLLKLREQISGLKHIHLLGWKDLTGACAFGYDNAKLVLSVKAAGRNGAWLARELYRKGQVVEMYGAAYVLCMTSVMDTPEAFDRLAEILKEMDGLLDRENVEDEDITDFAESDDNIIKGQKDIDVVLGIGEAFGAPREWMELKDCRGRVAGDFVYAYPPGSPLLVPGERISGSLLNQIRQCIADGLNMKGIKDGMLSVVI